MPKLPGNSPLLSRDGQALTSLAAINRLDIPEKEALYATLLPKRLFETLQFDPATLCNPAGERLVQVIAPEGLSFVRIEVRARTDDADVVFFAELADTQFHQMELAFCIICDPAAPRFAVDVTEAGAVNYFTSQGRNQQEELRAMQAGLFPHQTRRGLRMFGDFFALAERFTDSLGMEMIVAEPLSYDNAIRYEQYGFDYLTGKRLMLEIDCQFQPGGRLQQRLDGSSPFRMPGMEQTVRGRSWAIHDGILDEPWDEIRIYKMIGVDAGLNTFPGRRIEEQH
ncbi:MAG: hypothetical protein PHN92_04045 [Geobacter sp.]|nr:hypothetical protein [Geobacter sp.]